MKKKIMYLLLTFLLLGSINVNAKYTIPNTAPVGFNDPSHPYGDGKDNDRSFIYNRDDMILSYSYNGNTQKSRIYEYGKNDIDTTKDLTKTGMETTNVPSNLNYVHAVSFGPENRLLDNTIAYLGLNNNKEVKLIIVSGAGKELASTTVSADNLSWINSNEDPEYYQMINMFSITAGDYDGDGKDEIIVAYNQTHYPNLVEYKFDKTNNKLTKVASTEQLFNQEFLNTRDNTNKDKPYALFEEDRKGQYGSNKLSIELKTGDLDYDGIEDLVVLSYANFCNNYDEYNYKIFKPYISVSKGKSGFKLEKTDGIYVTNNSKQTILGAGFDVTNIDASKSDEIIVAGGHTTYTLNNNNLKSYSKSTTYGFAEYKLENNKLKEVFFKNQEDLDKYTKVNMSYTDDKIYSKASVLGAYLKGKEKPAQVFVNGNIYTINGTNIVKETEFTSLDNEGNKSVGFYQAVRGNFYNDPDRKDIVRFISILKQSGEDDYNFYYTELKNDGGDIITYSDSIKFIDNKGDNLGQYLNAVLISGDFNSDSMILKYNTKDYRYADVDVLVLLQATPYFSEIEDYYNNFGGTTYSRSREVNMTNSKGDSVAFSASIYTNVTIGTSFAKAQISMSAGYSMNWNKTFTETHSYEVEESWTATTDDTVVVYYVPFITYYYNAYDVETKQWIPNGFVITIESNPIYDQLTVAQYNKLVDDYNSQIKSNDIPKLDKIDTKASYLETSGNLHAYPEIGANGIVTYGDTVKKASSSDALAATTYSNGVESGFSTEIAHGFNFGLSAGVALGSESEGYAVEIGLETNLEYLKSKGTEESVKNSIEIEANVGNYKGQALIDEGNSEEQAEAYTFEWKLAEWDSNIKFGGKPIKVVGYAVQNINEPPHKVENFTVTPNVSGNSIKSIDLAWDEVEDADYYFVYVNEGEDWSEPIKVNGNSYSFREDIKQDSYTFRIASVKDYYDKNNVLRQSLSIYSMETTYVYFDGFVIVSYEKADSITDPNTGRVVDVYKLTLSNGNDVYINVENGKDGLNGQNGKDGKDAIQPQIRINDKNMWEVSYDNGKTWTSLNISATGVDGKNGKNGITPQLRYNDDNSSFEVSYDDGNTWQTLMEMSALYGDTQQVVTPLMRINPNTNEWEVSYDNGLTYKTLNVKATGENGQDGTTTVIEVAVAATVATSGAAAGAFYIIKKKALTLLAK